MQSPRFLERFAKMGVPVQKMTATGNLKFDQTNCDVLMIGRGSIINPFIFHQIKAHFSKIPYTPTWDSLLNYFDTYIAAIPPDMSMRVRVNKMKQLTSFLFKGTPTLLEKRQTILTSACPDLNSFLEFSLPLLKEGMQF